jgi:hypothetical protein
VVWPYVDAILRLHESVDSFVAWLEYHVAAAPPTFIFPQPFKFQGIALVPSLVRETRAGAMVVWIEGDYVPNHEPSTPSPTRRSRVAKFEIVRTGERIKVSASCLERLLSVWFLALLGEIARDYPEAIAGLSEYVGTRSGRVPGAEGKHLLAELLKLGEEDYAEAVLDYVGAKPLMDPEDRSQSARPSLVHQPGPLYSCFISYSSHDKAFAEKLHADLVAAGVECWFAPEDMKIGDKLWDRLDQSIRIHDKLLLVLSERSIASDWVEDEVATAFEEERKRGKTVLFPVRLDDAVMATREPWAAKVRQRNIGDFCNWRDFEAYEKAFARLLRDLRAEADSPNPSQAEDTSR